MKQSKRLTRTAFNVPPKNLKGIMTYVRPEVYDRIQKLADKELRSVSSMTAYLVEKALEQLDNQK